MNRRTWAYGYSLSSNTIEWQKAMSQAPSYVSRQEALSPWNCVICGQQSIMISSAGPGYNACKQLGVPSSAAHVHRADRSTVDKPSNNMPQFMANHRIVVVKGEWWGRVKKRHANLPFRMCVVDDSTAHLLAVG